MIAKIPYSEGVFKHRPAIGTWLTVGDELVEVVGNGPDYIIIRTPGRLERARHRVARLWFRLLGGGWF